MKDERFHWFRYVLNSLFHGAIFFYLTFNILEYVQKIYIFSIKSVSLKSLENKC